MNNYNFQNNISTDANECTSRGACSLAPSIAALQEVLFYFIKQSSYYILKLNKMGADNKSINLEIINDIASLIPINEFSENQLFSLITKQFYLLKNVKQTYLNLCQTNNEKALNLKFNIDFNENTTINNTISQGEKLFFTNYKKLTQEQRCLTDILILVIKSVCSNLSKLNDFDGIDSEIYINVLKAINIYNQRNYKPENIKKHLNNLSCLNNKLSIKISEHALKQFGKLSETEVSLSTRKGKAILVSGNNFFDLLNILEQSKDLPIDIYTHGNLLIAHAFEKFQKYDNLKGHYGKENSNAILDFATFPGAILLTGNAGYNTDYLYRGRLFSNNNVIPQGLTKVDNNDYSELIKTAIDSKGFKTGKNKPSLRLGYNLDDFETKIQNCIEKLKTGEFKKLYIIGTDNYSEIRKEYFNDFYSNLNKDEAVLTLSYKCEKKNSLNIYIGNYDPLAVDLIFNILTKLKEFSDKITYICTNCSVMGFSNLINLKNQLNIKNLYMNNCPPQIINPSTLDLFTKTYGIKLTTDAKTDLNIMRNNF